MSLGGSQASRPRPGTTESSPPASGRLWGIDMARALAVLGMLAVHVGPTGEDGVAGTVYALPHGRASVLFVLLAGVGIALLARSRRTSRGEARARLAWRAALLLPAGLALQMLDHGALVILAQYAVLFAVATLLLDASDRLLLWLAAVLALLGPAVHAVGRSVAPATFERSGAALTDPPSTIAVELLATGGYPLIVWAAPFLLGMWVGRRMLADRHVQHRLLWGGIVVGVAAWGASSLLTGLLGEPAGAGDPRVLINGSAHSNMPLWLLSSTGLAVAALGGCLLAVRRLGRAAWPLVAIGQFAVTIYVGHLVALHLAPDTLTSDEVASAVLLLAGFTIVAGSLAVLWRALFAYGPLEALLHLPWLVRRSRAREDAQAASSTLITGTQRPSRPRAVHRARR